MIEYVWYSFKYNEFFIRPFKDEMLCIFEENLFETSICLGEL